MKHYYSEVDVYGYVIRSQFTTNQYDTVKDGHRLLLDSPPNPPEYIPGKTKPLRIEPVPNNEDKIIYHIVEDIDPTLNELLSEDEMKKYEIAL